MSRLKDLVIDVETHLGSLLNDDGLTNEQALTVIEQEEFVVGGQKFKGTFNLLILYLRNSYIIF